MRFLPLAIFTLCSASSLAQAPRSVGVVTPGATEFVWVSGPNAGKVCAAETLNLDGHTPAPAGQAWIWVVGDMPPTSAANWIQWQGPYAMIDVYQMLVQKCAYGPGLGGVKLLN